MAYHTDQFNARDGTRLHENIWLPEGEIQSVMILVHGITDHSGRYGGLAELLNGCGCGVYAPDLRGHGRSGGERAWTRSFEQYVDDLDLACRRVRARQPGKPLFLFGHSMGGTIILWLALTRRPDLRGLVLSVPALVMGDAVYPLLRRVAPLVGTLFPRLRIVRMTGRHISRDPRAVEDFQIDPLVFHGRLPSRTAAEVLRAARGLSRRLALVEHPFLVLHGTADRVTDPQGSRQLYARAKSPDKTIRLYEGLYHDLLHELERDRVLADVAQWIDVRQGSAVM